MASRTSSANKKKTFNEKLLDKFLDLVCRTLVGIIVGVVLTYFQVWRILPDITAVSNFPPDKQGVRYCSPSTPVPITPTPRPTPTDTTSTNVGLSATAPYVPAPSASNFVNYRLLRQWEAQPAIISVCNTARVSIKIVDRSLEPWLTTLLMNTGRAPPLDYVSRLQAKHEAQLFRATDNMYNQIYLVLFWTVKNESHLGGLHEWRTFVFKYLLFVTFYDLGRINNTWQPACFASSCKTCNGV
ncbi:MAG TPA: hypothetical protein VGE45_18780 [Chloroflexia bacterium]|jgi:hypothetical protein